MKKEKAENPVKSRQILNSTDTMEIIEVNINENLIGELTKKPEYKYWIVSENGDIDEKFVPEKQLYPSYPIPAERLNELNWLTQIFKKVGPYWPDQKKIEFYFAYVEALKNAGFTSIYINLKNEE